MNTRAMKRLAGLGAVAIGVCAVAADAQPRGGRGGGGGPGPSGGAGGGNAVATVGGGPGPFGGVPSQPARMISLGNQGGIPLYRTNTLLPPDAAQFRPRGNGGWRGDGRWGGGPTPTPIFGRGGTGDAGSGGGLFFNPGGSTGINGGTLRRSVGSTGTILNGSYRNDNWNVRFHLGSGLNYANHGGGNGWPNCNPSHWGSNCSPNWNCYPRYCYYPLNWYGNYWGGYDWYPSVVYSGPWYGTDPFLTQGQAPAAQQPAQSTSASTPPREPTSVEKAEIAWRSGRNGESIQYFKKHLDQEPADADSMRYFAMVLIDERRIDQAVAMMAMAYEKNPKLANNVLPVELLPGGAVEQRRRVNAVSTYANRVKTSSAWLTLAALIQSEGRDEVAAKVIEKAKAAGGNPKVLDEMLLGLNTQ